MTKIAHTITKIEDERFYIEGENFQLTYLTFGEDEDVIYVERIDVDEEHRGKGIGTAVLQMLTYKHGAVFVAPDNEDSKRLFERIGLDAYEESNPRQFYDNSIDYLDQGYGVYEIC